MGPRRADLFGAVALLALATAYLWRFVGGGESLAGGDLVNHYLPARHVVLQALAAGDWPWWNPLLFSGTPAVGDVNAALFYPPNWLSLWVPLARWFSLTTWLHILSGVVGAYAFQRRAGFSVPAAMLGAAAFWLSGFFVFNLNSGIILFHQAAAWWPWAMLAVLEWMRSGHRPWLAVLAVSLAAMFLAGAPQIAFYAGLAAGAYSLALLWGHAHVRERLTGLVLSSLLTALLVQVQFLPAREWGAMSQRATWTCAQEWELKTGDSLMARSLLLALTPTLCGDPTDRGRQWATVQGAHEVIPAVLVPVPVLLLTGLLLRAPSGSVLPLPHVSQRRWLLLHLLLGLFALTMAFGRNSPLFRLLWDVLPGIQEFRVPARMQIIGLWCMACLVTALFDRLWLITASSECASRRRVVVCGGITLALGLLLIVAFTIADTRRLLLALGMPPGAESQMPPGVSPRQFLATHLSSFPELVSEARAALLRASLATALTGLALVVAGASRRGLLLALGLGVAALSQSALTPRFISTRPTGEFWRSLYPESDAASAIRDQLGDGRLLPHDSVFGYVSEGIHPELMPNRSLVLGIAGARGYDPIVNANYARLVNAAAGLPIETPAFGRLAVPSVRDWALARELNPSLMASYEPLGDPMLEPLGADQTGLHLYRVRMPGRPVRLFHHAVMSSGDPGSDLAHIAGRLPQRFDPVRSILLHDGDAPAVSGGLPAGEGDARLLERGHDHAVYALRASTEGYLLTDIPWHPGWTALVDGEPGHVTRGNLVWNAVHVPAGEHRVDLRFRPTSLLRGGLLSAAGLLLTLAVCVTPRKRDRADPKIRPVSGIASAECQADLS